MWPLKLGFNSYEIFFDRPRKGNILIQVTEK